MRNTFTKSLFALGLLIIALQAFAVELSLKDLRQEVLDENLDIKIQYEKYYQAQKGVSVALGEFLPSANINLINVNATLAILQSVVPTPSDWFAYQSSKELRVAEKFTTESIKLNILEGLTINFVNLKYHESLLKSLTAQEALLAESLVEVQKREEIGVATASDVFVARRALLQHKQDIFMLKALIVSEKQSMMIALNRSPLDELELAELPAENMEVIPETNDEGARLAINNSTELISNMYQAEAAYYMVSSKRWSFVSFNGIGFDYGATLSIEKSKARIIELEGERIALKINNQVYAAYEALNILDQRIVLQEQVVESVKLMNARNIELYENNAISFKQYYESRDAVTSEERALVRLQMERTVKIAQIKRLLGLDSSLSRTDAQDISSLEISAYTENARRGAKHVWVSLNGNEELLKNVFSVNFTVENVIADRRVLAADSELSVYFKAYEKGMYKVTTKILLLTGEVIMKEQFITVE